MYAVLVYPAQISTNGARNKIHGRVGDRYPSLCGCYTCMCVCGI